MHPTQNPAVFPRLAMDQCQHSTATPVEQNILTTNDINQDPNQTNHREVMENMEVDTDNEQASISTIAESETLPKTYSQALSGSTGPRRTNTELTLIVKSWTKITHKIMAERKSTAFDQS
ncbi:881_t:CDS:1, partial [Gigaspora rosea]